MTPEQAAHFRDDGILQEVNRQFLHTVGYALAVDPDTGDA